MKTNKLLCAKGEIMHNFYRHAIKDFEGETGKSYDDALYPTPEAVTPNLRKLVAKIKMYGASARQLEIRNELAEFLGPNRAASVPKDKEYLLEEMEECKAAEELWGNVANA